LDIRQHRGAERFDRPSYPRRIRVVVDIEGQHGKVRARPLLLREACPQFGRIEAGTHVDEDANPVIGA